MTVRDGESRASLDAYLHHRFYSLAQRVPPILHGTSTETGEPQAGRRLRLSCCRLVDSAVAGRQQMLLPSEGMAVVVGEADTWLGGTGGETVDGVLALLAAGECHDVWLCTRVLEVGAVEAARPPRQRRVAVRLEDVNDPLTTCKGIELWLWDNHTSMAALFSKGDVLHLHRPHVSSHEGLAVVEYGPKTVIYTRPVHYHTETVAGSQHTQTPLSQVKVRRDENGIADYGVYGDRLFVCDLQPKSTNITLLARVVRLSKNLQVAVNGTQTDRFCVKLEDESGVVDVTTWGAVAKQAASLQVGHLVLLLGVQTAPGRQGAQFPVNCAPANGGRIFNLSGMVGVLNTPPLSAIITPLSFLRQAPTHPDSVDCCRATITTWTPLPGHSLVVPVHTTCLRPATNESDLLSGMDSDDDVIMCDDVTAPATHHCPHCCEANVPVTTALMVQFTLEDGTSSLTASVWPRAMMDLLGAGASRGGEKAAREQLDSLVGTDHVYTVTTVVEEGLFRIDAAAPVSPHHRP